LQISPQWREYARNCGKDIVTQNPRLNLEQIAIKVHQKMKEDNIQGRGGKIPSAPTIRRHALIGIKG